MVTVVHLCYSHTKKLTFFSNIWEAVYSQTKMSAECQNVLSMSSVYWVQNEALIMYLKIVCI